MIVAIDVGLRRIGVAFGYDNSIAIPADPIIRDNRKNAAMKLSKLLKENGATKLIVGIPKGGSSEDEMKRRIEHFVSLIEFDGDIVYVDESFSTFEAQNLATFSSKKKDGKRDSLAAMIILQRYFAL